MSADSFIEDAMLLNNPSRQLNKNQNHESVQNWVKSSKWKGKCDCDSFYG